MRARWACAIAVAMALGQGETLAQTALPADAEMRKQRFLRDILDPVNGASAYAVERDRQRCAGGVSPYNDRISRSRGIYFLPDSSDTCLATLTRTARDGKLLLLYRDLEKALTGDSAGHEHLPGAIGAAAKKNEPVVALGAGKGMTLKPALAFDAGYTIGYTEGFPTTPPTVSDARMKEVAEGCLDQQGSLNNCFVVGRLYGYRANGARLSAR